MKKLTAEMKIEIARGVIERASITDEDLVQDLYIKALEFNGIGPLSSQEHALKISLQDIISEHLSQRMEIPGGLMMLAFLTDNNVEDDDSETKDPDFMDALLYNKMLRDFFNNF